MPTFTDSLLGYARDILKRDGYRCRNCGFDGVTLEALVEGCMPLVQKTRD